VNGDPNASRRDAGDPYAIVGTPLVDKPWLAEVEVTHERAAALIESQCPALAPVTLSLMGAGWDNTAYLVNGEWVFRFPRRTIAVPLLETEGRVLPALAPRLPCPIPTPVWFGRPDAGYKWPFLGYRRLEGHVASDMDLDDAARAALALPVARFLRALHDVPLAETQAWGVPPDAFGYLDGARLERLARPALADLVARGTLADAGPWLDVLEAGLAALPLAMRMVPPNNYFGLRTPRTMDSASHWYLVHAVGGQILNVNADFAANELVHVLQPYKIIFLTGTGGLLDGDGDLIDSINLSTEYDELMSQPWVHSGMRVKMEQIHELLMQLPPASSVSITRPDELAKELFTHRHTIRYRLERVRDLTGLDVSSTDGRERLGLGLKAMRVLGIASPQGPATEAGAGGGRVRREQKDR